ncbi:PhoH family protein [Calditrichota bacterium]
MSKPTESYDVLDIPISDEVFRRMLGDRDNHLRHIEHHFKSRLTARGGRITVSGPADERTLLKRIFTDLEELAKGRRNLDLQDVETILMLSGLGKSEEQNDKAPLDAPTVLESVKGAIKPRTSQQAKYAEMMTRMAVVFAIGPAGTGKTFLAVANAVEKFHRRLVDKIILVRPVVETGETLGFLPGDILEKVNPYFRPLYDALEEMLTPERVRRFIDRGMIEVAPLAYMRGRTLNNAVVILDEAQNTTSGQMKMFLTRLGKDSTAVLTGDLTQIDLAEPGESGLLQAQQLLQGIDGIGFVEFSDQDVIRHKLVAEILRAYQRDNNGNKSE